MFKWLFKKKGCAKHMNNKLEVIGIDHGWSMMKTISQVFVTGVKEITTTPALFGDVLEYEGKFYKVGTVRQEVKDTKVEDDSFYLLTLAAVAKELKRRGLAEAKVFLAVGLPLTRFGAEKNDFIKYLTKNKRVSFKYENEPYYIEIDDVAVFPQCYAAVVDKIPTMAKKTLIVDIGSWTIDIMPVINKSPDESKCVTIPKGLITCMRSINEQCVRQLNGEVDESEIQNIMRYGRSDIDDEYFAIIKAEIEDFVDKVYNSIREFGYNLKTTPIVFVGGGAVVMKNFGSHDAKNISYNDGVDTAREDNEFTPLRNWFNEFYARDTSKKIRAVKQAKAQKGERVNGEAPYGYLIDPDNRNHLIPDPETAHVVKQIFAMYVRGDRMCEIQNWLRDNEILTVGELRYRRTGSKRHPRPQLNAWYNWPDKTLYDILTRKEYLGHTITGKTYKVSYKSKKTKKNPEEKRYFFPNTHEPLIDEETFELAQKRIATRQRPTKVDEIDLFSGLLFCGDCGYKMYAVRGAGTLERKHAYTCGNYRNRARNDMLCTTHYIRKSVLKELVLADLQRVTSYVKEHEQEFIETANECSAKAVQKTLTQQRKELDKAQSRISELNILFRKLYEDNALGKLSDEQFAFLTSGYDEEKKTLTRRIAELSQEIDNATERSADVKRFVALVRRYTAIEELTYENVHEFIDRILIHELDKETNTRKIEIFYSFVGRVDTGDKPTESISYFRQIGADVKSYAI